MSILLAEDDTFYQKLATRLLTKAGHQVTVAANGREAVEACQRQEFDFILMDLQMPEMDGIQAASAIREQEKAAGRHTPIIALTAQDSGDRDRCIQAGMDDFVTKPLRIQELTKVMEQCRTSAAPGPSCPTTPHFSIDYLRDLTGDDEELMHELMQNFIDNTAQRWSEFEAACQVNDAAVMRRCAHSIKGMAGTIGAEALQGLARRAEESAAAHDLDTVSQIFEELELSLNHSQQDLRNALKNKGQGS